MITLMSYFSEKLNAILLSLGWSAYELGKQSGLNKQYCYKLIGGERIPEDETLEKIANIREFKEKGINIDELKSWRSKDRGQEINKRYPDDDSLIEALKIRLPDKDKRDKFIKEVFGE